MSQVVMSMQNCMLELHCAPVLEGLRPRQDALDQLTVVSTTRGLQHCGMLSVVDGDGACWLSKNLELFIVIKRQCKEDFPRNHAVYRACMSIGGLVS